MTILGQQLTGEGQKRRDIKEILLQYNQDHQHFINRNFLCTIAIQTSNCYPF